MINYIRATAEVSISEGKINEFRKGAAEIINKVETRGNKKVSPAEKLGSARCG